MKRNARQWPLRICSMPHRLLFWHRSHFIIQITINERNHIVPNKAPTAVQVIPKTTTSVNVVMKVAEGNTDVSFYKAGYQQQHCSVKSGASPRSCSIRGLSEGTRFGIYAMACVAGHECSYRTYAYGFTLPDGKQQLVCQFSLLSLSQSRYLIAFIEPKGIMIGGVSPTSFRVSLQAPAGNSGIRRFKVSVEGGCTVKTCFLEKSASPLQCQFGGLIPATRYTVKAWSCLPKSIGCSGNVTALGATTPSGAFYTIFS